MTHQSVVLVGNLLFDIFIDTTIQPIPAGIDGPVHRPPEELNRLLHRVDIGTALRPAAGVTTRAGGAAGNVARVLAERGHPSSLYGAVGRDDFRERYTTQLGRPPLAGLIDAHLWDTKSTGYSITWYDPSGQETSRALVCPPPTLPQEIWPALRSSNTTIVYLDGYALPGFLTGGNAHSLDLVTSGASLVLDLAHPYVTGRCAAELGALLAGPAVAGRGPTVFASTEELAPLGGLNALAASIDKGSMLLVIKEPPVGASVYRLHRHRAEVLTQFRGAVVRAVDTTGLGDAFVGGWIAAVLDGQQSADELVRRAHAAAQACALCVGGATGGVGCA